MGLTCAPKHSVTFPKTQTNFLMCFIVLPVWLNSLMHLWAWRQRVRAFTAIRCACSQLLFVQQICAWLCSLRLLLKMRKQKSSLLKTMKMIPCKCQSKFFPFIASQRHKSMSWFLLFSLVSFLRLRTLLLARRLWDDYMAVMNHVCYVQTLICSGFVIVC